VKVSEYADLDAVAQAALVQVVARSGREDVLFRVASQLEQAWRAGQIDAARCAEGSSLEPPGIASCAGRHPDGGRSPRAVVARVTAAARIEAVTRAARWSSVW
jgi:hypothetical protein